MTDEYIRRQDMIDLWDKYHATIAVDAIEYDMRLKRLPSADVVQVVHGKWIDVGSLSCRCDQCGCKSNKETRFCPNCGSKMDAQGEE